MNLSSAVASDGEASMIKNCVKCRLYFFTKVFMLPPEGEGGDTRQFREFVRKERGRL